MKPERKLHILKSTLLFVALFLLPASASAMSVDKVQYTPGETVEVTCDYSFLSFELYDITPGIDGVVAQGGYLGSNACGSPTPLTFDSISGHQYATIEVSNGSCSDQDYSDCNGNGLGNLVGSSLFSVGDSNIENPPPDDSGGGGQPPPPGLNKNTYEPGETVYYTCQNPGLSFALYDLTSGIGGVAESGGYLGDFSCGSPLTFASVDAHHYAVVEVTNGGCSDQDYSSCTSNSFGNFIGSAEFDVVMLAQENVGGNSLLPSVLLLLPKAGEVFSKSVSVNYSTQKSTQVILYYSTTLADWAGEAIYPADRSMVAQDLPLQGPYVWDTSKLTSGAWYRVIVDAIGRGGIGAEEVSGLFTIDQDEPLFTVSVNPPATHGEDVTVSVDSSKELQMPPTVTVTQNGGSVVTVVMSSTTNTHFEGTYKVTPGHDGVAIVTVVGTSKAGNKGGTIVDGGTFGVGVNPPPKVVVKTPLPNTVFGSSTITLTGSTRPDTTIVVKVNGVDLYKAVPSKDGGFMVPGIVLRADHGGSNILSVAAVDVTGVPSEAVPVVVRYNIAPTVSIGSPTATSTSLSGSVAFTAVATDPNSDLLLFTYQIISEKDFADATSSQNWTTLLGDTISSRYNFDTTQLEDGQYRLKVLVDDGAIKVHSEVVQVTVHNTLPYFTFEDGRKSVSKQAPVTIVGRALEPKGLSPQPTLTKVEYSVDNGKKWTTVTIDQTGRFSISFQGSTTTLEGSYSMLWRATDSRKLVGRTTHMVVIDKTPPLAPVVTAPRTNSAITNQVDEDLVKSGVQVTLLGLAEPLSVVSLTAEGVVRTAKAGINGVFAFHGVGIVAGNNEVTLSATDQAGNSSAAARSTYIYDNAPQISITSPKSNRGFRAMAPLAWRITDADGDKPQGLTVSYRHTGGIFTQLPIAEGATSYNWDVSNLPQGSDYELRVSAGDGLATTTETIGFVIDRTAPTLSAITFLKTVLGKLGTLQFSGAATDALSGIEYVEYAVMPQGSESTDANWYTALITSGFLQKSAAFSLTQSTTLSDGSYRVYVRAVDAAGNVSAPEQQDIMVDATPPRVGSFEAETGSVELAPDSVGTLTVYASSTVLFGVSLEADTANASLTVGGTDVPLKRDITSGLWKAKVVVASSMPILLTANDELGNQYSKKQIGTFTTTAPGVIISDEAPVPGAMLRVLTKDERGDFVATGVDIAVDSFGQYELALSAGEYELVAFAPGYATVSKKLSLTHSTLVSTSFTTKPIGGVRQLIQSVVDYFSYGI